MISSEHTRMQVESTNRMERFKAEINLNLQAQMSNTNAHTQELVGKLERLANEGFRVANEERVLASLKFDEWKRRFTDVRKAHKRTFDWMLGEQEEVSVPPTNFRHWLQFGDGIYWIGGKAGSGKSTLLKFLVDHPTTSADLQRWAGPEAKTIMVSWFFWNAGSPMQRSREGLFQSLLFQILRRCPYLIPTVCSQRWDDDGMYGDKSDPWTLDELEDAFDVLAQQILLSVKFCMFIDGLDEYDGLPNELIRILERVVKSDSIKLCVSSRPWNEFLDAFADGHCAGDIRLERYTKKDVERFVRDILEKDKSFTNAERRDSRYRIFIDQIIERAKGVFLWVYLVVNELLKGLGERNRLEDLQRKLDTTPETLDEYFQRIFDRIDKADRSESAKSFLVTAHAVQPLSVTGYYFLQKEDLESEYALRAPIGHITALSTYKIRSEIMDRVNFLCKDLLEVNEVTRDGLLDYQVDFVHRTVKDFLMTKDMHQQLVQRATSDLTSDWDAHETLCAIALACTKTLKLSNGIRRGLNILFTLVDEFMFYAHEVEIEKHKSDVRLLDELDRVVSHYADADMACHWTNARDPPTGMYFDEFNHNCFLALAIQSRLCLYVKHKLEKDCKLMRTKKGRPLLDYALRPNIVTPTKLPHLVEFIDFEMVRLLLENGANPNEKVSIYGNITVWGLFLLHCFERKSASDAQTQGTWFQAAEMMIRRGADRQLKLETVRKELVDSDTMKSGPLVTAKYKRTLAKGGGYVEVQTPVELTALNIMGEVFGSDKLGEIEAIVPDRQSWSIWKAIGWS